MDGNDTQQQHSAVLEDTCTFPSNVSNMSFVAERPQAASTPAGNSGLGSNQLRNFDNLSCSRQEVMSSHSPDRLGTNASLAGFKYEFQSPDRLGNGANINSSRQEFQFSDRLGNSDNLSGSRQEIQSTDRLGNIDSLGFSRHECQSQNKLGKIQNPSGSMLGNIRNNSDSTSETCKEHGNTQNIPGYAGVRNFQRHASPDIRDGYRFRRGVPMGYDQSEPVFSRGPDMEYDHVNPAEHYPVDPIEMYYPKGRYTTSQFVDQPYRVRDSRSMYSHRTGPYQGIPAPGESKLRYSDMQNDHMQKPIKNEKIQKEKKSITTNTFAHGMMDISLLTSNATQLRALIAYPDHQFFTLLLWLIGFSIALQITSGVLLIMSDYFKTQVKEKDLQHQKKRKFLSFLSLSLVTIVTSLNILISAFNTPSNAQGQVYNHGHKSEVPVFSSADLYRGRNHTEL